MYCTKLISASYMCCFTYIYIYTHVSKKFGDLCALLWHHPWCGGRGLKIKQTSVLPRSSKSRETSFAPNIKFRALFSHGFTHFFICPTCFQIFQPLDSNEMKIDEINDEP